MQDGTQRRDRDHRDEREEPPGAFPTPFGDGEPDEQEQKSDRHVARILDRVGEETIRVIAPLNFESVTEGRLRAIRRLREAVCQLVG